MPKSDIPTHAKLTVRNETKQKYLQIKREVPPMRMVDVAGVLGCLWDHADPAVRAAAMQDYFRRNPIGVPVVAA